MIVNDKIYGQNYLDYIIENNISGQMKIAPEHCNNKVLALMGKPSAESLRQFIETFNKTAKRKAFLTYYFIAAYPGCSHSDMQELKNFINKNIKFTPEQVQIFMPAPSTIAACMYYVEKDFFGNKIFVEKDRNKKQFQKKIICGF
jgi:radical SAM superfamily enzyme YgiQ (UPF0313 family)